ncbi:MAG: carboxypeptidase regulatory-like domain-containing protein [Verrucomicrobia bacterium]|nr:carboxypeptidase regulatory-like domain-containing protein [Verrucomicrobiota bacterium]
MKPITGTILATVLVSASLGVLLSNGCFTNNSQREGDGSGLNPVPRLPEEFDSSASNRWAFRQVSRTWAEEPLAKAAMEGIKSDRKWNWKRPINFFGVVFDEENRPIENAEVNFQWNEADRGTQSATAFSDDRGYVKLLDRRGYVLLATARKDGYYTTRLGNIYLNYAEPWDPKFHQPDPDRHVILKLRRKGVPEPLIERRMLTFPGSAEEGVISIDLLGQRAFDEVADLRIRMNHGPIVETAGRRRFDWTVEVEAIDGGLIEYSSREEFPFLAPEFGYEPVFRIAMRADSPQWESNFTKRFFFRTRGGMHFGRMELRVSPFPENAPPTVTLVEYYLNPAGSRNLEFSPDLEVSQKYYVPQN